MSDQLPTPATPRPAIRRTRVLGGVSVGVIALAAFVTWRMQRVDAPARVQKQAPEPGAVAAIDVTVSAQTHAVNGARVTAVSNGRVGCSGQTDATGEAQLSDCPRGPLKVLIEASAFARVTRVLDLQSDASIHVDLEPGAILRGRVHDETNVPIAAATVVVRLLGSGDPTSEAPWSVTTEPDGTFVIDTLPQTSVTLEASAGDIYEAAVIAEVILPNDAPVDVSMRRTAAVSGKVVDPDRSVVAGARVTLAGSGVWPPRVYTSDAHGEFRFEHVPEGIYELRAERGTGVSAPLEGIPINPGAEARVELVLMAGQGLHGLVRDIATGRLLPGAAIEVSEESLSASPKRARSGDDGHFEVSGLRPLAHRVTVRAPGYVTAQKWATPGLAAFNIDMLRSIVIEGSVQDADGQAVAQAEIEVSGRSLTGYAVRMVGPLNDLAESSPPDTLAMPGGNLGVTAGAVPLIPLSGSSSALATAMHATGPAADGGFRSDEHGHFRLQGVPPGDLVLAGRKLGYGTGRSHPLQVHAGETVTGVLLVLPRGVLLTGRVVDPHGTPIAHVRVELKMAGEAIRSTASARDGSFRFEAARGECTLLARSSGAPVAKLIVPADQVGQKDVELVIDAGSERLEGRVLDERGLPVESASVRLDTGRGAEFTTTAVSASDGSFEFNALPPPPYRLQVEHPDYTPTGVIPVTSTAKAIVIRLEPGASLRGLVSSHTGGEPVVNARLSIRATDTNRIARSGRDGMFEFRHLTIGSYSLLVEADGFISARRQGELEGRQALEHIELVRAGSGSGEVVDRLGAVVWNAEVAAGAPPDWEHAARTDHAGHFVLGQLTPGDHVLTARTRNSAVVSDVALRIYEGQETPGVVLRLPDIADTGPETAPPAKQVIKPVEPLPASTQQLDAAMPDWEPQPAPTGATEASEGFLAKDGNVVVDHITPGSANARNGLQPGDILLSVSGIPVRSPAQARGLLNPQTPQRQTWLVIDIRRGGRSIRVHYETR